MLKSFYSTWIAISNTLIILLPGFVVAQAYPINPNQDILHYNFNIVLNEGRIDIMGKATILFTLKHQDSLVLDLIGLRADGRGMIVDSVSSSGVAASFTHENDRLIITSENHDNIAQNEITIYYRGVPAAGLIMGDNKFGEPVFFGDNYPDRARNWLPCVDHPADKAKVTWVITAPNHYKVVASGKLVSEIETGKHRLSTTWDEQVPISTKVMTFGAANFAVDNSGNVNGVPITTWVYEQNKEDGFIDFALAPEVLAYYDSLIGPYSYEKLANVQSKTTYGGMENAGNIFYFENSVNGKGEREILIAHEIAHQWFGNSATERDWPHAWLSEGFATYFTHVYVNSRYGLEIMNQRLISDREKVIKYWHRNPLPIVNYSLVSFPRVVNFRLLLNTNSYQKGSWVLHMLRNELGDIAFWQVIHKYYADYRDSVATTSDFQRVAEEVSGKQLETFFKQWLYGTGQPVIRGKWQYSENNLMVELNQLQSKPFTFPLEIGFVYENEIMVKSVNITSANERFSFTAPKPISIIIDPNTKLLFEGDLYLEKN